MSEHTPTPWVIRPERHDDWGWIRGADGELACIARHHDRKDDDKHRMDKTDPYAANAALIVKAVNNHERLVKAVQDLLYGMQRVSERPDSLVALSIWSNAEEKANAILTDLIAPRHT